MNIMNRFTIRTLKMNKVRTLITIIGIILSVSMLTAVTTFISSIQQFAINYTIYNDGSWHGAIYQLEDEDLKNVLSDKEVIKAGTGQYVGYAFIETMNDYKPYIYVQGIGEDFTDLVPVRLTSGTMPKEKGEIILPNHLKYNGGVDYTVGDSITLEIGDRYAEGEILYQQNPFLSGMEPSISESSEIPIKEELRVRETKTYKVVGFYDRPTFENFSAPGYTALTLEDKDVNTVYDTYIEVKHPKDIYSYISGLYAGRGATYNSSYLRYLNASNNDNFNATLYSLGTVLIIIIMFGSISLIYNAFSISVSERIKQFGLISSIGGTKRQIIKSVLFEAVVLSGIGIPLGILSGIAGIGITLKLTETLFFDILNTNVPISLFVSWIAVVIAGIVGFITVLLSAYIPAKRAGKVSAIDAIRQTKEIQIKNKNMKTSPLVYKLFGLEGMIASKNFKRNRKKYQATVLSLFMSVVLFISASSFCVYLAKGTGTAVEELDYDIYYSFNPDDAQGTGVKEAAALLGNVEGVTKLGYNKSIYTSIKVKREDLNKKYYDYFSEEFSLEVDEDGLVTIPGNIYFVDDDTFREYRKEKGYADTNKETLTPIVLANISYYIQEDGKYYIYEVINKKSVDFYLQEEEIEGQETKVEETKGKRERLTAGVETEAPFGIRDASYGPLTAVFPLSQMDKVFEILGQENQDINYPFSMFLKTTNHKEVYKKLYTAAEEGGLAPYRLYNAMESTESNRAMITIIRVFSYGFITLISLIAVANVFNTITTNIALRRVEFAMLKSTGMTRKGFRKMMNYECLLYGIRSLIFGIPVSIGITYLIYKSVGNGVDMEFFLPWDSIIIAVGSVFVVVFSTMLYSMHKINKENTIDTLKNENI